VSPGKDDETAGLRDLTPGRRAPGPVVVGRAVLALIAAGAVVAALVLARHAERAGASASAGARYVCPMHAEVGAGAPAACPICGMALVKVVAASALLPPPAPAAAQPRYSTDQVRHHVLHQELFAPAWIESEGVVAALLYGDELASLTANEPATFFSTAAPRIGIDVRAAAEPAAVWDRSMSLVRFALDAGHAGQPRLPPPHTPGWLRLANKPRTTLVVPSMAVLPSADGPYVLVVAGDRRTVSKRPVELGKASSLFTAVVAGAQLREQVVSTNAFFVDAERQLRADRGAPDEIAP
jgi:hypothetical protein